MSVALLAARLALAAVFLTAGGAKLADLPGSRRALLGFGVPERLARWLGLALPLAELAAALALMPRASARWGAVLALALLVLFCGAILRAILGGQTTECHCFGQLHSAKVGPATLWRNAVLACVGGFVVWQGWADPGPSAIGWLGRLSVTEDFALVVGAAMVAAVAAEGWVLLNLVQQNGRLLVRVEALEAGTGRAAAGAGAPATAPGLPVGVVAPPFRLPTLSGETLGLDTLRAAGKPVALVFLDANCGPCNALMPEIGRWQRDERDLVIAVVAHGNTDALHAKGTEHELARVLLQADREVANAYRVSGTPSAVLIRPDGAIGAPLAQGVGAVRALIASVVGAPSPAGAGLPAGPGMRPAAPAIGAPAPTFTLPDLAGQEMALADLAGRETVILFWNPDCGFCQRMLGELRNWEVDQPPDAPQLVLVATGSAAANRAMALRAPILLDAAFTVGRAFGATGTPSAVRLDAKTRIASDIAVGAPAVLELLNRQPIAVAAGMD